MKKNPSHITPPRLAEKLLLWFLKDELAEEVLGDLEEKFSSTIITKSVSRAKRNYWYQVLKYIRPFALKHNRSINSNQTAMFKHNILISFRSFKRFKTTFGINLLGLATGLASALLIYLWVNDELNVDNFNEKDSQRHVQIIYSYPTSGTIQTELNGAPNPLFEALAEEMPEVEYAVPVVIDPYYKGVLSAGDNSARAQFQFIGNGYFNIFPGDFIHGNKHKILSDKGEVAISEKLALSLFQSTEKAMGQLVELKNEGYGGSYLVSGVFKSSPNSSTASDALFSYELFRNPEMMKWYNGGTQAHLVLKEGVDLDQFNAKIKDFLKTVWKNSNFILYAQPYSEGYLYGNYEQGIPVAGRIIYVRLFSIIALFVLAIACINYMNFSTAKASRRIKEIGVKKAIGVGRKSLIIQYFSESLFMAFLSLIIAIGIAFLLLPQFNEITGKQLTFNLGSDAILSILGITAFTGLISGIYPALLLSGFNPVVALKGKLKSEIKGVWLRKGLVVFQFAISVILIVSVIVIYKQVEFIQTTNLGYNKDHIITFAKEGKLQKDAQAFFTEVKNIPGVVNASQMNGELPGRIGFSQGFKWEGMSEEDKNLRFHIISGGYDLIDLLGIRLKEGRDFSRDFPTDKDAYILNETALKMTKLENPIGQKFGNFNPNARTKEIIGVVENFHFQSLQEEIRPLFFRLSDQAEKFVVKIQAGTERETISRIEELYEGLNEGYPFEYKFLDDDYQALYASEERISVLSKYFAGIAIAISCLGLLALTAFSTQRRFKEIAIRKVLGSSGTDIVRLLSQDFIRLVFLAILIALPVSYYLMKNWLNDFAFRIGLDPMYFVIAGVLMMVVAWLTIMTQTAKSAKVNVTESLRSE
ncbi:FtsX-like permease family protein [Roseivirga sp. E12]|uniref:FtsX-like permease family protein n=1 Tax=Roseivirga sp. E12 TaxID=2819237 RepID=UPI001ABC18B2|nr:ABC transporter permease [Roseivirga sp. E12]